MKKTLAILLALIMSASVALVSCNDSSSTTDDENDDFVVDFAGDNINDESKDVETNEKGETINTSGNNTSNNNGSSSNTTMTATNDTVYVLYKAKIRETAKETGKVLAEVPFATSVSRAEANSKWSKVTYNGVTGYIMNDLLTTSADTVTFEDQGVAGEGEGAAKVYPTTKVSGAGNVRLRYYPLADGYPHKLVLLDTNDLGEIGQILGGTEVTVLEVSKDKMWAKVTCVKVDKPVNGEYKKNYTSTETGYIPYSFLEIGANSNNNSGGNDPSL